MWRNIFIGKKINRYGNCLIIIHLDKKNLEKAIRKNITLDEKCGLENLKRYKILYTRSEPIFDQLAAYTATMLNTPIAVINFVNKESVWTNSAQQPIATSKPQKENNLCALAIINESANAFEKIAEHPCLLSNALIAGELGMQFYAAVPITTDEGFNVGTVCIVDRKRRTFSTEEKEQLEWVAFMVRKEMNKRIAEREYA